MSAAADRRKRMVRVLRLLAAIALLAASPQFALAQDQAPGATQEVPSPATQPGDPFGEEVTLTPKTLVMLKGTATWDRAYETLVDAFKTIQDYLDKEGLKAIGPGMTIYTSTEDTGFNFQAGIPVAEAPAKKPEGELSIGTSPEGRALRFTHRGSYDAMDTTYDAITNHLDEKRLEARDMFIEEYETDLVTTPDDQLVVHVIVPLK
jgi:effector-binding domain-containing protein